MRAKTKTQTHANKFSRRENIAQRCVLEKDDVIAAELLRTLRLRVHLLLWFLLLLWIWNARLGLGDAFAVVGSGRGGLLLACFLGHVDVCVWIKCCASATNGFARPKTTENNGQAGVPNVLFTPTAWLSLLPPRSKSTAGWPLCSTLYY